jgi:hypothetical protein
MIALTWLRIDCRAQTGDDDSLVWLHRKHQPSPRLEEGSYRLPTYFPDDKYLLIVCATSTAPFMNRSSFRGSERAHCCGFDGSKGRIGGSVTVSLWIAVGSAVVVP